MCIILLTPSVNPTAINTYIVSQINACKNMESLMAAMKVRYITIRQNGDYS